MVAFNAAFDWAAVGELIPRNALAVARSGLIALELREGEVRGDAVVSQFERDSD